MGPARRANGAEGPDAGAEWAGRQVRSERRPGALLESARSLAFVPHGRGANVPAVLYLKLYLNCGRKRGRMLWP